MKEDLNKNSKSGWGQYFTSSLGLVVTGLACGTVATIATIYGSPFVAIGFAATGAVALNAFVIKDIRKIKEENNKSDESLRKKYGDREFDNINEQLGKSYKAEQLANFGICSGAVGILSAASSAIVGSLQAISQDPNTNLKNAGASLTVTGGTAILVGFSAFTILGARAGKLKEKVLGPQDQAVTNSKTSAIELAKKDDPSTTKRI